MKKNLKKTGWGLLIGLAMVLAVISCRKDDSSSPLSPDSQEAGKLKDWYLSKMIASEENPFAKMKPRWNSVYVNENASQRVYEVDLENPERVLAKLGRPDRSTLGREEKRHMMRLLIFENRMTGKILYASYMSIESGAGPVPKDFHYKQVGDFSGTVLFYHFGGVLSNGWDYENGNITRQIRAISKSDFDLLNQSGPKGKVMALVTTCSSGYAEKFRWSCVGVPGYENCGWISAGYEYVTVCTTKEASDVPNTEEDGGTSGDYFPPIYVDCAGVEDGSAYWNTQCSTCMGGTTGITECPLKFTKEIKVDPNARQCVKDIVAALLGQADDIKSVVTEVMILANVNASAAISRMDELNNYNIKISETTINDKVQTDPSGQVTTIERTNGRTDPITGDIFMNTLTLDEATDLAVASTLIHEMMHSYFVYGTKYATGNEKVFFTDMNEFLFNSNGTPLPAGAQPTVQHVQMAATYVDSMASLLAKYAMSRGIFQSPDSSISLVTYCKDLFWRNLITSQAYINAPNKSRAITNGDREFKNQSGTNKKGCK